MNTVKITFISASLTIMSYFVAIVAGWITLDVNPVEVGAVFFSYLSVLQCIYQTRWNYVTGIAGTLCYSLLFYQLGLYAVAVFNLYLVFSQIYGFYRWRDDSHTRPVTLVTPVWWLSYVGVALVIFALYGFVNNYFGYSPSIIEIIIVVLSATAQNLLDNKKLESWSFWILVDLISLVFYFHSELYLVAFQYVFFTVNAFIGLFAWFESYYDDYLGARE